MWYQIRSFLHAFIFSALILVLALPAAHAQTQASCTFKLFLLNPSGKNLVPQGINDYTTVVGKASGQGFTRFANGGITYYSVPNSFPPISLIGMIKASTSACIPVRVLPPTRKDSCCKDQPYFYRASQVRLWNHPDWD